MKNNFSIISKCAIEDNIPFSHFRSGMSISHGKTDKTSWEESITHRYASDIKKSAAQLKRCAAVLLRRTYDKLSCIPAKGKCISLILRCISLIRSRIPEYMGGTFIHIREVSHVCGKTENIHGEIPDVVSGLSGILGALPQIVKHAANVLVSTPVVWRNSAYLIDCTADVHGGAAHSCRKLPAYKKNTATYDINAPGLCRNTAAESGGTTEHIKNIKT